MLSSLIKIIPASQVYTKSLVIYTSVVRGFWFVANRYLHFEAFIDKTMCAGNKMVIRISGRNFFFIKKNLNVIKMSF